LQKAKLGLLRRILSMAEKPVRNELMRIGIITGLFGRKFEYRTRSVACHATHAGPDNHYVIVLV
jgi:hypothetical protein